MTNATKAIIRRAAVIADRARIFSWVGRLTAAAARRSNVRGETTMALAFGRALMTLLGDPETSDDEDFGALLEGERAGVRKELDRLAPQDKDRRELIEETIREFLSVRKGEVLTEEVIHECAHTGSAYVEHVLGDYVTAADPDDVVTTAWTTDGRGDA